MYLSYQTQIALLKIYKALTAILLEYADFAHVFSVNLAVKFSEYAKINDQIIELIDSKQSLYKPIYSLEPVELKALKIYIKINLANGFIRSSKSLISTSIFVI